MSIAATSYFAALIVQGDPKTFLKHGKIGPLFRSDADQHLFQFFDHHVHEYGKLPDVQTVLHHGKTELPDPKEPPEYYLTILRKSFIEVSIRDAAKKAEGKLTGEDKDPEAALILLTESLAGIQAHQMQDTVTDYRESGPALLEEYKKIMKGAGQTGLRFGWPTLDKMTGGLQDGDVISWAGNPGLGKTMMLLWSAVAMWKQGRPPLFVSMEIKPLPILQRLSAIHAQKGLGAIKGGSLTTAAYKGYTQVLTGLKDMPVPFWVVDGNLQATIKDINALALQLKPGVIFVDGAYLARHPTERDRYRRIAENMDAIKTDLASRCPVITSWQFNREARKLKKGDRPGLEHIGGSDTIGQHSSLVLALFEDESIETVQGREVTVLKGRNGEAGSFKTRWTFEGTTDFSEIPEETLDTLQF